MGEKICPKSDNKSNSLGFSDKWRKKNFSLLFQWISSFSLRLILFFCLLQKNGYTFLLKFTRINWIGWVVHLMRRWFTSFVSDWFRTWFFSFITSQCMAGSYFRCDCESARIEMAWIRTQFWLHASVPIEQINVRI